MKIDGVDLNGLARTTVRLHRPAQALDIEVEAFPFGFDVAELLPFPTPPVTGVRKKGGEVLRDGQGQPILIRDEDDPDYRRRRDEVFWLRMAALFYYAVRPCGQVHFDVKGAPEADPVAFFAQVADEIKAAGLTSEEVNAVIEATREISQFSDEQSEAAEGAFFPGASGRSEGRGRGAPDSTRCVPSVSGSA